MREAARRIAVGKVSGVYGVKGWLRIYSYTQPRENILNYSPWFLAKDGEFEEYCLVAGQRQGKGVFARLEGVDSREEAACLCGGQILIAREQLPPTSRGEYYWADLVGLKVYTSTGVFLGEVRDLMETGANDVLVVQGERERLIPFIQGQVIKTIDLEEGVIFVDWDPDF